jgi:hypothetical protein
MEQPKDFDKLLLDSIDDALLSLGASARESIYLHIERTFNLTRNEIPQRLEQFQLALEKIFGVGSTFIEILIMKNIHRKTSDALHMEENQLEFIKYVNAVRNGFMKKTFNQDNS